jgi:hypothetical protein
MNKRPASITIISWLFIVMGTVGLIASFFPYFDMPAARAFAEFKGHWYVHVSRLASIVAGVFMLYGCNWVRWLLVAWLAFHVGISFLHSPLMVLFHAVIAGAILYFLFRRHASAFFRKQS